jgi:hypothetical protein
MVRGLISGIVFCYNNRVIRSGHVDLRRLRKHVFNSRVRSFDSSLFPPPPPCACSQPRFTTIYESAAKMFSSAKSENSQREQAYRRRVARLRAMEDKERRLAQERVRLERIREDQEESNQDQPQKSRNESHARAQQQGSADGGGQKKSVDRVARGRGEGGKDGGGGRRAEGGGWDKGYDLWRYKASRQMIEGQGIAVQVCMWCVCVCARACVRVCARACVL